MLSYDSSKVIQTTNNGLATGLSSLRVYRGFPVFAYSKLALIDMGAMYRNRIWDFRFDFLKQVRALVESDEYEFFAVAIPSNNLNATIAYKDTYRTQFQIPEGSFLIGISGCAS